MNGAKRCFTWEWTSVLLREIEKRSPKTPSPTIEGSINKLIENFPKEIYKPSRGLFEWVVTENPKSEPASSKEEKKESAYYEPFAKWLIAQDEVTVAIPLGGTITQTNGRPLTFSVQ